MIIRKILKVVCLILVNKFLSTTRFFSIKRKLLNFAGFSVGNNTKVVGPLSIGTCANLVIGENCWIGKNLIIHGNGSVVIGNNCDLAPDIMFLTGSHEVGDRKRRAGHGISFKIEIKNGCWIGARSTIVGNTKVNEGVIIGTNSLVNKSVISDIIVAGMPAKEIKRL